MAEQTILVRFHLGAADDEDTRHNNRVWLQDQLSSRFDLDEVEFVDDPAEKVTQIAQKRYGLTLTEDERSSLQRILHYADAAGDPEAYDLWRKVRDL